MSPARVMSLAILFWCAVAFGVGYLHHRNSAHPVTRMVDQPRCFPHTELMSVTAGFPLCSDWEYDIPERT